VGLLDERRDALPDAWETRTRSTLESFGNQV
jgi:hypothetical protein